MAAEGFSLLPHVHDNSTRCCATGVSSDGSVIVGIEGRLSDRQAVRWTLGDDVLVEHLDYLPGADHGRAEAVSPDDSCAVGYGYDLDGQDAFRCVDTGPMQGLGDLLDGDTGRDASPTNAMSVRARADTDTKGGV